MMGRWIPVSEAANVAGVTRQAVHAWIARGHLTAVQCADSKDYWIDADGVTQFLATRQAAHTVGVRIETIRQWQVDGHGAEES
jgi:hypothetical protein